MTVSLTRKETVWGWRYLLFQLLFLPGLLNFVNQITTLLLEASVLNFIYFLINFVVVLFLFGRFLLANLRATRPLRLLMTAVIGLGVYQLASYGVSALIHFLYPDFFNVNDQSIGAMAEGRFLLTLAGTVFLVPVAEEVFYRGILFGSLYRLNKYLAYTLSIFIFALIHILGYIGTYPIDLLALCLLQYVPAGLCLAWAYETSDSILCPILMHSLINAIGIFTLR